MNVIGSQACPVTPDAWDLQEMREALSQRDVSEIYRQLRRKGISQRQIAALTGQSQSEVSEILKGRQVMAYDVLARIADGLNIPRGYMGLAYDEATAVRVATSEVDPQAEEDESVKRRRFLAHAATVTMGAAVITTSSTSLVANAAPSPAPNNIGLTDVRQVEAVTRALRALDYQYGGGAIVDAVVAQLSWAQQLLDATATDAVRKRLHVALADQYILAGWSMFDTGLNQEARTHFTRALELAQSAGNHEMVANILYRMGRVLLHQGDANDALKLLQLGQIRAQESGSELAVSVLCANQAWAYAALGSEGQAQKLLSRARDEFSRADHRDRPPWVAFFDEHELSAIIGAVHTQLALQVDRKHTRFAIPALTKACDGFNSDMARSKAFNLSILAANHMVEGDVDHATRIGLQAVDLAEGIKSARTKVRILPLKAQTDRRANNADARDLSERINKFLAT